MGARSPRCGAACGREVLSLASEWSGLSECAQHPCELGAGSRWPVRKELIEQHDEAMAHLVYGVAACLRECELCPARVTRIGGAYDEPC